MDELPAVTAPIPLRTDGTAPATTIADGIMRWPSGRFEQRLNEALATVLNDDRDFVLELLVQAGLRPPPAVASFEVTTPHLRAVALVAAAERDDDDALSLLLDDALEDEDPIVLVTALMLVTAYRKLNYRGVLCV